MNTRVLRNTEEESQETANSAALGAVACTAPALGELLPEYIAELLSDLIAQEFEDHLLDCLSCREKHLKVLSIGEALRKANPALNDREEGEPQDESASGGSKVFKIAGFKKSQL
jgi:hypothetical protein